VTTPSGGCQAQVRPDAARSGRHCLPTLRGSEREWPASCRACGQKPGARRSSTFSILTFDAEGRIDPSRFEKQQFAIGLPCNDRVASTTVWLLSSANTPKTCEDRLREGKIAAFRNLLGSMRPSASKVRMENVLRTTRAGFLATSSTTTLAILARCPAKSARQCPAGSSQHPVETGA